MANMYDYIEKYKDKDMKEFPLTEIDYAILSNLSYCKFEGIVSSSNASISLEEAAERVLVSPNAKLYRPEYDMLKAIMKTKRYKDILLSNFSSKFDTENHIQFAAMVINTKVNNEKILSFRGTDGTFTGWRENFDMAYKNPVEADKLACEYLERVSILHPFSKLVLAGHSKGGHQAIYATCNSSLFTNLKIKKTYSFDGPGLNTDLDLKLRNKSAISKCESFSTYGSVIGRLFYHEEKVNVVGSSLNNIWQHASYSWNIDDDKFVKTEKFSKVSDTIDVIVKKALENATMNEKELLSEAIYNLAVGTGCEDVRELLANKKKIIGSYARLPKRSKKILKKFAYELLKDLAVRNYIMGENEKSKPTNFEFSYEQFENNALFSKWVDTIVDEYENEENLQNKTAVYEPVINKKFIKKSKNFEEDENGLTLI